MRINEIITESEELEEGWKSKLGAAALAGAAMLGGGHQDAQAQNYQPTAQTQRSTTSATSQSPIPANLKKWVSTTDGTPNGRRVYTQSLTELALAMGEAVAYSNAGVLNQEQGKIFQKYLNIYKQSREILDPQFRKILDGNFNTRFQMHEKGATNARRGLDNMRTDADYKRFSAGVNNHIAHLLNLERKEKAENTPLPKNSTYGDTIVDQVPQVSAPWQKYYTTMINDMNRDTMAVKNELRKQLTPDQKMELKRQVDSVIISYTTGPNGIVGAEKAGLNKDAAKMLNKQLDSLKSLSASLR